MSRHDMRAFAPPTYRHGSVHVIFDPNTGYRSSARKRLRDAVEGFLAGLGWQSLRLPSGRRIAAALDGSPVPPISISYSGPLALVAISPDWRPVGVDLELCETGRTYRYDRIESEYLDRRSPDPMATFVRAEAWSKALDYGFAFGPGYFFRGSTEAGPRDGGKRVDDLDLRFLLPELDVGPVRVQAAVCCDITAPPMSIHSFGRMAPLPAPGDAVPAPANRKG